MVKQLFIYLIFFITLTSNAQEIKVFTKTQGLSNQWISSIYQDNNHFFWIATQNGLNKFDGFNTKVYQNNFFNSNSLSGNWITSVCQTEKGNLWIGSFAGGLIFFNLNKQTFTNYSRKSNSDFGFNGLIVNAIWKTHNNVIWFSSDTGLYKIVQNKAVNVLSKSKKVSFTQTSLGVIYVVSDEKLYQYKNEKINVVAPLINYKIEQIIGSIDNSLFLLINKDIYEYKNKKLTQVTHLNSVKTTSTIYKKAIYLSTATTLKKLHLESKKTKNYGSSFLFNTNEILNLYQDKQGLLWVGTKKGLFKENELGALFTTTVPIHARRVLAKNDTVYIGGNTGLYQYNPSTKLHKEIIDNTSVLSMKTINNKLWVGGNNTIRILENNKIKKQIVLLKGKKASQSVFAIEQDENQTIWVGAWKGLYKLNTKGEVLNFYQPKQNGLQRNTQIVQMLLSRKGDLWIATSGNGLYKIKNIANNTNVNFTSYKQNITNKNSLNNNIILDIHEDIHGNIWVGTEFGISLYREKTNDFERLSKDNELSTRKIMAISSDVSGNLWINTISKGVYVYNPSKKETINLQEEDGLLDNSGLFSSKFRHKNQLYFGTEKGVQILALNELKIPNKSLNPKISSIKTIDAFNEPKEYFLTDKNEIQVAKEDRNLQFNFYLFDYKYSSKVDFFYKLNNQNNNWIKANNGIGLVTNIPYGKNNLLVKSVYNKEKIKSATITSIFIDIDKPWYLTHSSFVLYFLLIIAIVFVIYKAQLNKRVALSEAKILKEADDLKTKMYANISHELRTPLTIITSVTKQLFGENIDNRLEKKLQYIEKSGEQLLHLVNQILDLISFDAKKTKRHFKNGDIISFINNCAKLYKPLADSKKIKLQFSTQKESLLMDFDDDKVQKIINNLLSNALKFTQEKGKVHIKLAIENEQLIILIEDTGKGIAAKHLPSIFDRYYKTFDTEENLGSGIGLALTKELVNVLKGKISAESTLNKGSIFRVQLPIENKINNQEKPSYKSPFLNSETDFSEEKIIETSQQEESILVVEDNNRIRNYLKEVLQNRYKIYTAINGESGLKLAKNKAIDIIISDVVMPKMTGLELCTILKNDVKTSHIPFIIVSAKSEEEDKIYAYKLGADAYLTKPFNVEELQLRIDNILSKQQVANQYYANILDLKNSKTVKESVQQIDINFMNVLVSKIFSEKLLSIEEIAVALKISRSQLHRKIKLLTNKSTSEYINYLKIEKAKKLLIITNLSIKEISYQVNYKSPAYLSKVFKEMVGVAPKAYKDKKMQQ
jgi:signal transduction histidine kinase/ligand-binding sensor domain-containing protein/DNA-binding response OmpR family regulator